MINRYPFSHHYNVYSENWGRTTRHRRHCLSCGVSVTRNRGGILHTRVTMVTAAAPPDVSCFFFFVFGKFPRGGHYNHISTPLTESQNNRGEGMNLTLGWKKKQTNIRTHFNMPRSSTTQHYLAIIIVINYSGLC